MDEKSFEEQAVGELIGALRRIEAALLGAPSGLRAAAIADRAVAELGAVHNLRRVERLYHDDREAKERAEAERDEHRAEVEQLRAECYRLTALMAGVVVDPPRRAEWVEWQGGLKLMATRLVEVAALLVDPASIGWEAGPHTGRVVGSGPEAIDLAKRIAEVAAGVSR